MIKEALIFIISIITLILVQACGKTDDNKQATERVKLYPPNEQINDESLNAFIDSLIMSIENKDSTFIMEHLDNNIHLTYGGSYGLDDFREIWRLDDTTTKFWITIEKILDLKGTLEDSIYIAPYVFSKWPDFDGFTYCAITSENVVMYSEGRTDSDQITILDYDIVKVDGDRCLPVQGTPDSEKDNPFGDKDWYYVQTTDSKYEGYVNWKYIRSPIDYRLLAKKIDGKWKITAFIAGD
jgi:hypothetical protein